MGHRMRVLVLAIVVVAVLAVVMPATSAEACSYKMHCVRSGETLFSIGRMYGVSPWTIAHHNGLVNPNYIVAGQCLKIPAAGCHGWHGGWYPAGSMYVPGHCNKWPECCAPPYPSYCYHHYAPAPATTKYCVKPCDTLFSIGRMYGVSPWAIAMANGLADPNYIRAGQCLVIPR